MTTYSSPFTDNNGNCVEITNSFSCFNLNGGAPKYPVVTVKMGYGPGVACAPFYETTVYKWNSNIQFRASVSGLRASVLFSR